MSFLTRTKSQKHFFRKNLLEQEPEPFLAITRPVIDKVFLQEWQTEFFLLDKRMEKYFCVQCEYEMNKPLNSDRQSPV